MGACRVIGGDKKCIDMVLPSSDAADYLNFVLKDASTNTWYDSNGSNFQLALRTSLRSFMSMDDAEFVRTPTTVSPGDCNPEQPIIDVFTFFWYREGVHVLFMTRTVEKY